VKGKVWGKKILKGISADFSAGTVTAIIGGLSALTLYILTGVLGYKHKMPMRKRKDKALPLYQPVEPVLTSTSHY
jgi:ABC-type hemin transport system ATPase subunit